MGTRIFSKMHMKILNASVFTIDFLLQLSFTTLNILVQNIYNSLWSINIMGITIFLAINVYIMGILVPMLLLWSI